MVTRPTSLTAVIERGYTDGVAERIARGSFTYTDRAALLAAGRQLGIDHTRANLIIARQQNKRNAQARPSGVLTAVATFAAVQGVVVAAAVWAFTA